MHRPTRHSLFAALLCLTTTACHTPPAIHTDEVDELLKTQLDAWHRGDFEEFCSTYWRDPRVTFCGSNGLRRGFDELVDGYRRGYPDAASRGRLSFALLEVRALDPGRALVIGEFELARAPANEDAHGIFTLLVERRPEGLRIVHDHSSELAAPAAPAPNPAGDDARE